MLPNSSRYDMETIFVQIASYRDSELIPTIKDCINKAKNPTSISFGICLQCDPETEDYEDLLFLNNLNNIRINLVHYKNSKGACWARSVAQSLYKGETYSLQIDSHMRFVKDWDEKLITMWKSLEDEMAILTAYPAKYLPNEDESQWPIEAPTTCNIKRIHNYRFKQVGHFIENHKSLTKPKRGVALSAAYIFAPGDVNIKVPYDPTLYFEGEEMSMALRYFTHGYNIYHPHFVILYHYWTRDGNKHHWSDHSTWGDLENTSTNRLKQLLTEPTKNNDIYGLGSIRTLSDYGKFAGIDFEKYIVHKYRLDNKEPPIEYPDDLWIDLSVKIKANIHLEWDTSKIEFNDDITFWCIKVLDNDDLELYNKIIGLDEYEDVIVGNTNKLSLEIEYNPIHEKIREFSVQTYSETKKWSSPYKFLIKSF